MTARTLTSAELCRLLPNYFVVSGDRLLTARYMSQTMQDCCTSVRQSHTGIVSKWMQLSSYNSFTSKTVHGSRYYRAPESVSIASALSITALTIYPCQIRVHQTLTVLNCNFLQLGRRSGGRPQRTVYPRRLPVNTVMHTTLAGIEPKTFRLLV